MATKELTERVCIVSLASAAILPFFVTSPDDYTCHGDTHVTVTVTQLALDAIIEKLQNCTTKPYVEESPPKGKE